MKKFISILLPFSMFAVLTACGESAKNSGSNKSKEKLPFEISSFSYTKNDDYLYYAVCLHNPNEDYFIEFPSFRITAKNADGEILGSEKMTLRGIFPNMDSWHGGQIFSITEEPATVDIEVIEPKDEKYLEATEIEYKDFKPLSVKNTTIRDNDYNYKFVGEVQNDNDYEIDNVVVTVVFKDESDNIIAGDITFVDNVKKVSSTAFEKSLYIDFATDNYDVYAEIW